MDLIPLRIKSGTVLGYEGCILNEVLLILRGCVGRESSIETKMGLPPQYLIEGTIFGEKEVMFNLELQATYTALCDCYILSITKENFNSLLQTSDHFKQQVIKVVRDRDQIRHNEIMRKKNGEPIEEPLMTQ